MRLLDVLLARIRPPEAERASKAARLSELEQEATHEVISAKRALSERKRLSGYDAVRFRR